MVAFACVAETGGGTLADSGTSNAFSYTSDFAEAVGLAVIFGFAETVGGI